MFSLLHNLNFSSTAKNNRENIFFPKKVKRSLVSERLMASQTQHNTLQYNAIQCNTKLYNTIHTIQYYLDLQ